MNKQNRGDMPKAPESVTFASGNPLNDTAPAAGFERDNIGGGNLRQHDGSKYTGAMVPSGTDGSAEVKGGGRPK